MVSVSWQVHARWHNCRLHPLIHTFPTKSSAPDVEKKEAEPKLRSIIPLLVGGGGFEPPDLPHVKGTLSH